MKDQGINTSLVLLKRSGLTADVREPGELQQEGQIPNAINLPLSTLQESLGLSETAFREKFDFDKPEKNKVFDHSK